MFNGVTNPIHAVARPPSQSGLLTHSAGRTAVGMAVDADEVQLSEAAMTEYENLESAPIRRELVDRVRAEIADGKYLTDERLERTADRLHRVLLERN